MLTQLTGKGLIWVIFQSPSFCLSAFWAAEKKLGIMTNDQSYGRTTVAEDDTLKASKSNLPVISNIEGIQVLGWETFGILSKVCGDLRVETSLFLPHLDKNLVNYITCNGGVHVGSLLCQEFTFGGQNPRLCRVWLGVWGCPTIHKLKGPRWLRLP